MILALLIAASAAHCAPIELSVAGNSKIFISRFARNSGGLAKTQANFATAYGRACKEGLFKAKPLISAKSADRKHLFLLNAPDANVASIYNAGSRTVLEYHFDNGAPSADDLHEAIYCAVHGANAKEQEESGRCLPD
jgi:hypothetical protein